MTKDGRNSGGSDEPLSSLHQKPVRKSLKDEVILTRRTLMGFLLASAGAAPAMAADPAKSPAAAAKVQTPDISAAQNATQAAAHLNIVDHSKDLTEFSVIRAADLVNMHVRLINMVVTLSLIHI